MTAAVRMQLKS